MRRIVRPRIDHDRRPVADDPRVGALERVDARVRREHPDRPQHRYSCSITWRGMVASSSGVGSRLSKHSACTSRRRRARRELRHGEPGRPVQLVRAVPPLGEEPARRGPPQIGHLDAVGGHRDAGTGLHGEVAGVEADRHLRRRHPVTERRQLLGCGRSHVGRCETVGRDEAVRGEGDARLLDQLAHRRGPRGLRRIAEPSLGVRLVVGIDRAAGERDVAGQEPTLGAAANDEHLGLARRRPRARTPPTRHDGSVARPRRSSSQVAAILRPWEPPRPPRSARASAPTDRSLSRRSWSSRSTVPAGSTRTRRWEPSGDFVTSPHVHPAFGMFVARALEPLAAALGSPTPLRISEVGAGDGTLARQILDALDAAYTAIEISAGARDALGDIDGLSVAERLAAPVDLVLAHELLDNLPFRVVEERCEVAIDLDGDALVERTVPIDDGSGGHARGRRHRGAPRRARRRARLHRRDRRRPRERLRAPDRLRRRGGGWAGARLPRPPPRRGHPRGARHRRHHRGGRPRVARSPRRTTRPPRLPHGAPERRAARARVRGLVPRASSSANRSTSRAGRASRRSARGRRARAPRCWWTRARSVGCDGSCSPLPVFPSPHGSAPHRTEGPIDLRRRPPLAFVLRTPGGNTKTRRSAIAALVAVLALIVAVSTGSSTPNVPTRADVATPAAPATEEGRGGSAEAAEQTEETQERLEALAEARAEGTAGVRTAALSLDPAPGWAGEYVLNAKADDWEPAIAADPSSPYVYVVATRYAAKPCPGNCPSPWMALSVSKDGGATWGAQRPLCACKGSGQFDPIIEVVPDTGAVYALFMNGYNVMFIRSNDHGKTWSDPVPTYGKVSWNDKPVLATSDDGRDVYVSWNGPKGGDPWLAQSHDAGKTWTQTRLENAEKYFYAYDADVTSSGRVVFAEGAVTLREQHRPGRAHRGPRLRLRRSGHDLERRRRGLVPAVDRVRGLPRGLLRGARGALGRRSRRVHDRVRRADDRSRAAAHLRASLDRRTGLEQPRGRLGQRRARDGAHDGVHRQRSCSPRLLPDGERRRPRPVERVVPFLRRRR